MNTIILIIGIILLIVGVVLAGYYGHRKFSAKKDTSKTTLYVFVGGCIGAGLGLVMTLIGAFTGKKTTSNTTAGYY